MGIHLRRVAFAVSSAFGWLSVLLVIVLLVLTVADVVSRNVRNEGIPGAVEAGSVILVAVVFLGLPVAQQRRAHVSTAVLTERLPRSLGVIARAAAALLMTILTGCFAVATFGAAVQSFQIREYVLGLINVPVWPAKLAIAAGLLALFCVALVGTFESAATLTIGRRRPSLGQGEHE